MIIIDPFNNNCFIIFLHTFFCHIKWKKYQIRHNMPPPPSTLPKTKELYNIMFNKIYFYTPPLSTQLLYALNVCFLKWIESIFCYVCAASFFFVPILFLAVIFSVCVYVCCINVITFPFNFYKWKFYVYMDSKHWSLILNFFFHLNFYMYEYMTKNTDDNTQTTVATTSF